MTHPKSGNVCSDLNVFCFPSTLPGFLLKEHKLKTDSLETSNLQSGSPLSIGTNQPNSGPSNRTWLSQSCRFKLLNGRTISCYLSSKETSGELSSIGSDIDKQNGFSSFRRTLLNQKSKNVSLKNSSNLIKPGTFDVSSPKVEISPPVLDWGQKYLFFPSLAFLTVANSFSDSILRIYEPFTTSSQFYPCNSSEILLGPGEVASICFVFLPTWLGLSTARLILQTSSGGFLVPTRGFGVESPYKIQPLAGLDVPSTGRLSKNLSLFNPYDDTLHVAEVTSWMSVSVGNTTHHTEASCSIENFQDSDEFGLTSIDDWLVVRSGQLGFPLMAMRPHKNWEIGPRNSEIIMEMDFPIGVEGKIFGAFCMKLLRSSQNLSDTVMVPLEVDVDSKVAYDDLPGPVSVSLEPLVSFDARGNVIAISLRNGAPYMLKVVRISEVAETSILQIKYMEGLLLFPGTVTQVAVITCTQKPVELQDSLPEVSMINGNCRLLVMTNDSSSPQIEIPCQDIIRVCSRCQTDSSKNNPGNVKAGNMRTRSAGTDRKVPSEIKAMETAEADEMVLGNWKSQGITSGLSVLDDHEVLFPMVLIGSYRSKWITVKNPSQQPVVMQLILNSGEIIDECRDADGFMEPPSSGSLVQGKSTRPTRYGFSIAERAVTEAYVHPHGRASFGPIFFHPSNRCAWRSSALIRNNLSGVEWLSLRGFGGSLSLVLLEGSDLVENIEFNLSLPVPQNITAPDILFNKEETISSCFQPLSKELYAKNTGDLPLEVRSIEVSGAGCRLDGFMVHTCKGFSLEPGESTKLLISYQTDFSAAMVYRDLEFALATGIFVIPMKASLPVFMLNICKKSVFWMRLKKLSIAVLAVSLMFLVFCCLYLQMIALGSQDYFYKSEKSSISATKTAGKSSRAHQNPKNSRISVPGEMDCLLRSVDEDRTSREAPSGKYTESKVGTSVKDMSGQHAKLTLESHEHPINYSDTQKEKASPRLPSKSLVVETSNTVEASHPDNLTIRVGREKGRKRRKRKVAGAVLSGVLEVSSSQSGNSTPSSPLSPVTSSITNRACLLSPDADQPNGSRYLFTQMTDRHCEKGPDSEPPAETKLLVPQPLRHHSTNQYSTPVQPTAPKKPASKPVLLASATSPSTDKADPSLLCSSPLLASASAMAPHARAPGSKLDQKTQREQAGLRDEYTYDIWGDHLSGLSSVGRSKAVGSVNYGATKNDSNSFFVSGPQTLMRNSQSISVSSFNQEG
ncbi:hypothetical protein CISIN_1g000724mg [Citrus sinensis]|nr:hypothetical protein CISIN_1g000724mg [Citrus sinensis]